MSENLHQSDLLQTGGRQTMSSWSKVIESPESIPDAFREAIAPFLKPLPAFPHMVLAPPLDKFLRRTSPKIIFDSQDTFHLFEQTGGQISQKSFPYEQLAMVEAGVILLNSWIRLIGRTREGGMAQGIIEFNTASERYYTPFLRKMRPAALESPDFETEQARFGFLSHLNYKFMNYGRASLVPGEKVLRVIFQPEISQTAWQWMGWKMQRIVSLTHLTILTDKELITIRDDERSKEIKGQRYGGVWQYIPRSKIQSARLEPIAENLLALHLVLEPGETLRSIFAAPNQKELESLCKDLSR